MPAESCLEWAQAALPPQPPPHHTLASNGEDNRGRQRGRRLNTCWGQVDPGREIIRLRSQMEWIHRRHVTGIIDEKLRCVRSAGTGESVRGGRRVWRGRDPERGSVPAPAHTTEEWGPNLRFRQRRSIPAPERGYASPATSAEDTRDGRRLGPAAGAEASRVARVPAPPLTVSPFEARVAHNAPSSVDYTCTQSPNV